MTVDFRYRKRGYVVLQVTDITKSASFYMIDATGDQPLIVDKKVVL